MKEVEIKMDAGQYVTSIAQITKGYEDLAKEMQRVVRTTKSMESGTSALENTIAELAKLEAGTVKGMERLAGTYSKIAASRTAANNAARPQIANQIEELKAIQSMVQAHIADANAIVKATQDKAAYNKELQAEILNTEKLRGLRVEKATKKDDNLADVRRDAAVQAEADRQLKFAQQRQAIADENYQRSLVGSANVRKASAQAQNSIAVGVRANDKAINKASQDSVKFAIGLQQQADKIDLQLKGATIRNETALIRQQKALQSLNTDVDKQLISWQSIQRILAGQIAFRMVSGAMQELSTAYDTALKYNKAVAEIRTISQAANISSKQWAEGLREVSNATGFSLLTTAEAAYQSLSNQVTKGAETFLFLRDASKFALAGVTDTKTAVDILSSAMNSYNVGTTETTKIAAAYFKTIELGRIRAEEIASTFGRLEVAGFQLGISYTEIGAAMATLTNQGINAAKSATGLNSLFVALLKPSDDMKLLFQELNVSSGEALISMYGFEGALVKLADATAGSSTELAKLLRNQRALMAGMVLAGNGLSLYQQNLIQIKDAAQSYANAQLIIKESTENVVNVATNKLTNFFAFLGSGGVEGFGAFIRGLNSVNLSLEQLVTAGAISLAIRQFGIFGAAVTATEAKLVSMGVFGTAAANQTTAAMTAATTATTGLGTAAKATAITFRTATVSTGIGALVIGISLGIGKLLELAATSNDVEGLIKRDMERIGIASEAQVKKLAATSKEYMDNITRVSVVSLAEARAASKEAYKEATKGFTTLSTELEGKLTRTVDAYKRGLTEIEKATERATKRASSILSEQIAAEADNVSIALARINNKGTDVKVAEKLKKLAVERANIIRDAGISELSLEEELGKATLKNATAAQTRVGLKISNLAQDKRDRLNAIIAEKQELEKKAEIEEQSLSLYRTKREEADKQIKAIAASNESGVDALKQWVTQYNAMTEAEKQVLINAGKYDEAEKLIQETLAKRIDLIEKIAKAELAVENSKAQRERDNETILFNMRLAHDKILEIGKAKARIAAKESAEKELKDAKLIEQLGGEALALQRQNPAIQLPTERTVSDIEDAQKLQSLAQVAVEREEQERRLSLAQKAVTQKLTDYDNALRTTKAQQTSYLETLRAASVRMAEITLSYEDGFAQKLPTTGLTKVFSGKDTSPEATAAALKDIKFGLEQVGKLPEALQKPYSDTLNASMEILTTRLAENNAQQVLYTKESQKLVDGQKAIDAELIKVTDRSTLIQKETVDVLRELRDALKNPINPILNAERKASGGAVGYYSRGGGPKGTDTVPAWLTPGEFVINRESTRRNRSLLEAINNNSFAGSSRPMSSPGYYATGGSVTTVGDIHISTTSSGSTQLDIVQLGQQLQREIRRGRVCLS